MKPFEYLKEYQTFNSVEEMDLEVDKHIQEHYYKLTKSERAIIYKIASHALDYPGVSHLKISTIANGLSISTKTVQRAINKFESLHIIKRQATKKMNGIKGANIYIFLKYNVPSKMSQQDEAEIPCESKDKITKSEKEPLLSFNLLKQALNNNKIYNISNSENTGSKDEKIKEYGNEYQKSIYNFINFMPFHKDIMEHAYEISMSLDMETKEDFILAKDSIKKTSLDMLDKLFVHSSVRATVQKMYNNAKKRRDCNVDLARYNWLKPKKEDKPYKKPPFDITSYNWLTV